MLKFEFIKNGHNAEDSEGGLDGGLDEQVQKKNSRVVCGAKTMEGVILISQSSQLKVA